jgi:hypothetical protein
MAVPVDESISTARWQVLSGGTGGRYVPRLFPRRIQPCRDVVPNVAARLEV